MEIWGTIGLGIYVFNGVGLKYMILGSVNLMARMKPDIDALNVFPVPDGDTGTNMYLTLLEANKELQEIASDKVGEVMEAAARGCLMGARGNSGVILSQVVRGMANALHGKSEATAEDLANAFQEGANLAYKAVSNPVEGTVLTVVRKTAEAGYIAANRSPDLLRFMITVFRQAVKALKETTEQLPILKEAGVVDAGGKGWVVILQGILQALRKAEQMELLHDFTVSQEKKITDFTIKDLEGDICYTYCTEFLIIGNNLPKEQIKRELQPYGDCLMVVGTEQVIKVHIHSNHPGLVIETCISYGQLNNLKISNMRIQNEALREKTENKSLAVVSVGLGEGINSIMESLGVDEVIVGGQTMNPSTEEILKAIDEVPSRNVIVLPNNKNIVMAAQQAASISEKSVQVVSTVSIPQGLAALLSFNPEGSLEENSQQMMSAKDGVRTGEITIAVRDTTINGMKIKYGDIIGLLDGRIVVSGKKTEKVIEELLHKLTVQGEELITFYYGEKISGDSAQKIIARLQEEYNDMEMELHYGGQPLYQYIISAE